MSDYPLLDLFWSMVILFVWLAWFMVLIRIVADVFRRQDIGGGAKVLWLILAIALPFVGVFAYLLVQSRQMTGRDAADLANAQRRYENGVRSMSASSSAGEIARAKQLLDAGAIDAAQFASLKAAALSHSR